MNTISSSSEPSVTTYLNRSTGFWHVNVYWPAVGNFPERRKRPSLRVREIDEVPRALQLFHERELPGMVATYERDLAMHTGKKLEDLTGGPHLRQVFDFYVDTYLPAKHAAERSITGIGQALHDFLRFAASHHVGRVSQLRPALVDEWARSMREGNLSAKTVSTRLGFLRAAFNAAIDRGIIGESPIKKWLIPKPPEPEIWPLTEDQLGEVVDIMYRLAPEIGNISAWIAMTGQRPSDARGLRWRQVDLKRCVVTRTQVKTQRLASFEISTAAAAVLKREQARKMGGDIVFTNREGRPFTANGLYNQFVRAIAATKFERRVNLKDLRHTFCSLAVNEWNIPLPQVQVLAGHSEIEMTMRYVHPTSSKAKLDAAQARYTENPGSPCHSSKKASKKRP